MNAEEQLKQLKDEILATNNFLIEPVIQVYPIEASVGKTHTVIESLKECSKEVRTLVVTKLMKEQEQIACALRETLGDGVLVYNSSCQYSDECVIKADVVIITHEKYRRLCMNKEEAKIFSIGRQLLIIDEYIDILSYHSININTINDVRKILDSSANENVWKLYTSVIFPIKQAIDKKFDESKGVKWLGQCFISNDIDEQIRQIVSQLKGVIVDSKNNKNSSIHSVQALITHIESLRYYFNTDKLLIDTGEIYSCNLDIQHLEGFNKTILLDASASFVELYQSSMFKINCAERIIDHGNTTFIHVDYNTTNTAKNYNLEKQKQIRNYISNNLDKKDKAVVFASKDEVDSCKYNFEHGQIAVETFSGSRGKNDWATYNKAFVVHTQSLPPYAYIFQYLYYFPKEASNIIGDNKAIEFKNGTGRQWSFVNNKRLHWFRITDIASNFYQAVKRVDRNKFDRINSVELHVLCSNAQVIEIVKKQLKGLKEVKYIELNSNKKKVAITQIADANRIYEVLNNLSDGTYKLAEVREMCEINHRESFNRALKCLEEEGITLHCLGVSKNGHKIIVSKAS